ncbi:MAG: DUF5337 domain-containing protein [Paracoccaceae bacterium]|nr:DUF5337 domain-containing protein [Paracoccaceae bacterium]
MEQSTDQKIAQRGRLLAIVIAGTMLFWLAALWIGPRIGLAGEYAVLIDLVVMATFVMALYNGLRLWRIRQKDKG